MAELKEEFNDSDTEDEDIEEEAAPVYVTTVQNNIIELKQSFGYDCKRLFNLCLIDDDTLVFASGNLLHYYSISKNNLILRRTVFGGGVGFVIKNPNPEYLDYLTIGENGTTATVFIYKYPEHDIVAKLVGGAVRGFTCGTYNNNGNLLATQAGAPDFMLTVWNWSKESIVLRSKAYQDIVLKVVFSRFNPILLASCGHSHIQFWKMARTFTGLKLKSASGRFGKTDTCDVYGIHMLVDEKVISGCEWGNMLVWEGGLIKFEVTRKARIPCHSKPITSITWMGNNEIMTIGMDGYARIWFWETVELADPPDEDRFVEIDPLYEFRIGNRDESCEIRHLIKIKPYDDTNSQYYSQDGNGGVWFCDLNTTANPLPPKKLFSCHGGKVVAAQTSPVSTHIATLGEDGKLNVYNYNIELLLFEEPFNAPGRDFIWLDTSVDPSGMVLIIGFEDGVVRQVALQLSERNGRVHFIDAIKPHSVPITFVEVSPNKQILVSGAMDNTMFLFQIKKNGSNYVELIPLGFHLFDGAPSCLCWNKRKPQTALIGCYTGEVYECELPPAESIDLVKVRPTWRIAPTSQRMLRFKSVKSEIRREQDRAATARRKARKLRAKKKEMKRLMEINPGLQMDESVLADSSEDEEEEPLHIPDPPNAVIWLMYTNEGTIWLSMAGYDAGYVYEVQFGKEEPISCTLIPEADDIEIHSYLYIDNYLIFGMRTGQIRINKIKPNFRDLTDFWLISMHDNLNGIIPYLLTSNDGKWFFSVGFDGNIFYYHWNGPQVVRECEPPTPFRVPDKVKRDIEDRNQLSLEEVNIEENLVKLHAFEENERRRLAPTFEVMQLQIDWTKEKTRQLFQKMLTAVLERLKHDVTGACHDAKDLFELMFDPLEYIPFEVYSIQYDTVVRVFRLPKLITASESFKEELDEEECVEEQSKEENSILLESRTTLVASNLSHISIFSTIYDFPEKVLLQFYIKILEFFTLLKQIKKEDIEQILEVCGYASEEEEESVVLSENAEKEEPNDEENGEEEEDEEEEEEEEMSVMERAITFLNNEIRENVEVMTLEISIINELLHSRKSEFNNKVLKLREAKSKLYMKYENLQTEIRLNEEEQVEEEEGEEEEEIILPPLRPIVIYHEKPEEVFKEPFIPLRSFESILWEKPMKEQPQKPDLEESVMEFDDDEEAEEEEEAGALEVAQSEEWTTDLENLFEKISEKIEQFDKELEEVQFNRKEYEIEIKYLDYLEEISTRELLILQDSEVTEKMLVERDEMAKNNRNELLTKIKRLKIDIETMLKNVTTMNQDIKKLQHEFNEAVKGNKFMKFLSRIFEKKFKPPKERDPDDETESSSEDSSSEDDDDAGSGDSGNVASILLDEAHCPSGCDRKLYDYAFEMRAARHALDQEIYNGYKSNEAKRNEIELLSKKLPEAEDVCATERNNLLAFRREKSQKLRAVEADVINGIEGFGWKLQAPQGDTEERYQYCDEILKRKREEAAFLKEELQPLTDEYTEKMKILLEWLIERDRLRKKKPSITKISKSEESISIVSVERPPTPPPPFDFEAYAAEKVLKLVQRFFFRYLSKYISEAYMKKYIPRVARCLGNIGRNFTCELADNIIQVIILNLQRIVPKKYLIHAQLDDIRSLFKDIVAVYELEPIEINPTTLITEIVSNSIKVLAKLKCANKTQRIILEISQKLMEELPMDDFRSFDTVRVLAKLLAKEPVIVPHCLNVEALVDQASAYAKEHMLSAATTKIIRNYAEELGKELAVRKADDMRTAKSRKNTCKSLLRKKRVVH